MLCADVPVLPRDSYLTSVQTNAKKEAETTGSVKGVALANEVKEFFDGVDGIVTGTDTEKQSAKTDMFNLYQDYKSKDVTSVPSRPYTWLVFLIGFLTWDGARCGVAGEPGERAGETVPQPGQRQSPAREPAHLRWYGAGLLRLACRHSGVGGRSRSSGRREIVHWNLFSRVTATITADADGAAPRAPATPPFSCPSRPPVCTGRPAPRPSQSRPPSPRCSRTTPSSAP